MLWSAELINQTVFTRELELHGHCLIIFLLFLKQDKFPKLTHQKLLEMLFYTATPF